MIVAPARATSLFEGNRIDARYFSAPAVRIRSVLAGSSEVELRTVGGANGYASIFAPSRFKRTYAAPGEEFVPYLRPYDVFEFLPPEADRLSVQRTENLETYLIKADDLLLTCSGRNLGPLTHADAYLERFALSHDMIRMSIEAETDRYYTLAFLRSRAGQHLLRGDLNGSVIDHITVDQVAAIQIPFIKPIQEKVAALYRDATKLRERARLILHAAVEEINREFPDSPESPYRDGWTLRANQLGTRLDAAFHSRHVDNLQSRLHDSGGVLLSEVADVRKPGGRYKTYYVNSGQGTPLLSGRQMLQLDVIGAKNISSRSIKSDSGYEIRSGWIIFQADGRAEESLGYPSVVTEERDGWFASGHVGRIIPHDLNDTGWLWAAIASNSVQRQIESLACGSVVDALYPGDLQGVVLPPRHLVNSEQVNQAWTDLGRAAKEAEHATRMIDDALQMLGVQA